MKQHALAEPWARWLALTALALLVLWILLMPARAMLLGTALSGILMAPWIATNGLWMPGHSLGLGPSLGSGLNLHIQHPVLAARLMVERARHGAAGSLTVAAVRAAIRDALAIGGSGQVALGEVREGDADTIEVAILARDGSVVGHLGIDRQTGAMRGIP